MIRQALRRYLGIEEQKLRLDRIEKRVYPTEDKIPEIKVSPLQGSDTQAPASNLRRI